MRLINWNVEWATPQWKRPKIIDRISQQKPEIACLTEADLDLLSTPGHSIYSQPHFGCKQQKGYRRKVLLWSKNPWQSVDDVGSDSLPPGRFISGITQTSIGELMIVGVCIPWSGSRTYTHCNPRKKRWQDHEDFLFGLKPVLEKALKMYDRIILVGDFNQRMSGKHVPVRLRGVLLEILPSRLKVISGELVHRNKQNIDHIAMSSNLSLIKPVEAIDNCCDGKELSDHFGVTADVVSA